jgi:hypothetical protein
MVGSQSYIHWITEKVKDVKNTGNYSWTVPADTAGFGWAEVLIRNTETGEQVASDAFLIN